MSGLLDDCRIGRKEEKGQRWDLRQWAHLPVVILVAGWEAKRKIELMAGAEVRRVAMVGSAGYGGALQTV